MLQAGTLYGMDAETVEAIQHEQHQRAREASTMLHEISGHNFHGRYRLRLRGPAEGFVLSDAQARRYWHELCPFADCTCGGGYGEGPDRDSATVDWDDDGQLRLYPAEGGPQ